MPFKTIIEPFKIKTVELIARTTQEKRHRRQAGGEVRPSGVTQKGLDI
jgi:hypothetical protein